MLRVGNIPGALTTAVGKAKINQACCLLLTFSKKPWRNILFLFSRQAKGQKLVVHGPNHLAHVSVCVYVYIYRERKKEAMS